jgi:hypothetical protein
MRVYMPDSRFDLTYKHSRSRGSYRKGMSNTLHRLFIYLKYGRVHMYAGAG